MDNKTSSPATTELTELKSAVSRILFPIVRLLLAYGLKFPQAAEMLMSTYVQVAEAESRSGNKPRIQGHVSERTGLPQGEVLRLMVENRRTRDMPEDVARGVAIATLWLSHADFRDEMGLPAPLPRRASAGGERSFEALVGRISKTVRYDLVLEEWIRLGMVILDEQDHVHMKADAYVPHKGVAEKLFFVGQNLHDHMDSAVHNVTQAGPPRLERSVFYDGLSEDSIAALAELAHKRGMEVLIEINNAAKSLREKDDADQPGTHRMNFGMYFFEGPKNED